MPAAEASSLTTVARTAVDERGIVPTLCQRPAKNTEQFVNQFLSCRQVFCLL